MRFEGKTVVITGASSGMGKDIALNLAKEGAVVVAVARRKERLEELADLAKDYTGKIIPYVGDVTSLETNEGMIECALKETGKLDVLINNAGIMDEFKPIGEVEPDYWHKVMDVNLTGPMFAMRKAVQVMLGQENGGNILNIASIGGVCGARAGATYTASKHALIGLSKNTAFMYAPNKIRCNVICPGGVETEVMNTQTNISQMGVGRVMAGLDTSLPGGHVEDITCMALLVTSDQGKFINGSVIVVDGGVSCN